MSIDSYSCIRCGTPLKETDEQSSYCFFCRNKVFRQGKRIPEKNPIYSMKVLAIALGCSGIGLVALEILQVIFPEA